MLNGLVVNGLAISSFDELDYPPYNGFSKAVEAGAGKYRIAHQENRIPMVYSIVASKKNKNSYHQKIPHADSR